MKPRLLIIDTDEIFCTYLDSMLGQYGYSCTIVHSGFDAICVLENQTIDLVIMDHELHDIGGFYLLRQILILQRTQVLMLSRDDTEYNRIRALDGGATDFVRKPIEYPAEFFGRIRAILKRSLRYEINLSRIQINLVHQIVKCDGEQIELQSQLFQFLVALASKPGQVVEHNVLLCALEDEYYASSNNILYVIAHRLRCSLESKPNKSQLICTVRGVGYLLNDS